MDDLREEFIAETRETLEILAGQLVQWEKDPSDKSLIDSAFRFVHTVKGSCGFWICRDCCGLAMRLKNC